MKRYFFKIQLIGFCLIFVFSSCAQKPSAKDFFNRAESQMKNQNWDSAIINYSKAIELDDKFADSYFGRGLTYLLLKDFEKSIADFDKTIEINPKFSEAYLSRGMAFFNWTIKISSLKI